MKAFREVWLADEGSDERVDNTVNEGVDDVFKGGADDDTDGQLNDVAARDEFLEALKHGVSCVKGRLSRHV